MDGDLTTILSGDEGDVQSAVQAADLSLALLRAAPNVLPTAPRAWPDRLMQGNALLRRVSPYLSPEHKLPEVPGFDNVPLLIAPCSGASTLIITFGGNTGFLMLPQSLITMPDVHLIAMRDPTRCFALCGVPGLGPDYRTTIETLRKLAEAMSVNRIFVTGVSAGGYPALRFALDLQAQGVLAFSPPTTLDVADDGDAPLSRYPQLTALYKRKRELAFDLDLARSYAAAPARPQALIVYSPSQARDTWLAGRMAHIEGVELEEVSPEAGHRVFLWLNNQNRVQCYFDRMLAMRELAPA